MKENRKSCSNPQCPCDNPQPISVFHKQKRGKFGVRSRCKVCASEEERIRRSNPDSSYQKTAPQRRAKSLKNYYNLKREAFDEYGWCCACPPCGEEEVLFLEIDHIQNNGAAHRLSFKKTGRKTKGNTTDVLTDLKKRGWPKDEAQTLCRNCNIGKQLNGGVCPHLTRGKVQIGQNNT